MTDMKPPRYIKQIDLDPPTDDEIWDQTEKPSMILDTVLVALGLVVMVFAVLGAICVFS